jgi:SAM-dependent methyltransferase
MDARNDSQDRIARERDFHNARFRDETREAQGKYYAAIKHGSRLFDERVRTLAVGADVLEYGCGNASQSCELARDARSVSGIDISEVAIEEARAKALAAGLANAVFETMNAEAMEFPDASFDLVFGRGILHHLDLDRSLSEIGRVLRPGGVALLWEPLGDNVFFNAYRALTPSARTPDEHPLREPDFDVARRWFGEVAVECFGLSSLLTVPFRDTRFGDVLLSVTSRLDRALFHIPKVKWQAWYCIMEMREPSHED